MRVSGIVIGLALLLLAGCGPEPTPFPVDVPQTPTTPAIIEQQVQALPRYALAMETAGLLPDLNLIESSALVLPLQAPVNPSDLGTDYEVVITYGQYPDWTPSPVVAQVSLLINSPYDALIRRAFQPQLIVDRLAFPGMTASAVESSAPTDIRTELANMGLPDGVELTLADTSVPGTELIVDQLRAAGFFARRVSMTPDEAREALSEGRVQVAIIMTTIPQEDALNLYTLPVSYRVVEGREVTFTPAGFPLVR